jgi:predicted DNA-binding WGR domain protein
MRRFEMREGTSAKFWEIEVSAETVTVHFGRIGTKGQQKSTEHADEASAQQAADKVIREKIDKGYVEVGADQSAAIPTSSTPAKRKPAKPRAAKPTPAAPRAWPDPPTPREAVRCFEPADDVLFRRGFPHLHVLSDEVPSPTSAIRTAKEALDAIDPRLHVVVPRDVARRFVLGYEIGSTWGNDAKAFIHFVPERVAARDAALARDRELDAEMLERFLRTRCPAAASTTAEVDGVAVNINEVETYAWRLHEVVHIFEAPRAPAARIS